MHSIEKLMKDIQERLAAIESKLGRLGEAQRITAEKEIRAILLLSLLASHQR
jgi:hypothetical protein